jgi:hypothetical protein
VQEPVQGQATVQVRAAEPAKAAAKATVQAPGEVSAKA